MILEKTIKAIERFARRLNSGAFDKTPAFTTGQVDHNGQVRRLDRGQSAVLIACGGPQVRQTKSLKWGNPEVLRPEQEEAIRDLHLSKEDEQAIRAQLLAVRNAEVK